MHAIAIGAADRDEVTAGVPTSDGNPAATCSGWRPAASEMRSRATNLPVRRTIEAIAMLVVLTTILPESRARIQP
jgi:hypothetical protein